MKSVPLHICSLSGDFCIREGEAKLQGRKFPKAFISLRSFRRPCSGRTRPVPYFYARAGHQYLLRHMKGKILSIPAPQLHPATPRLPPLPHRELRLLKGNRFCLLRSSQGYQRCERSLAGKEYVHRLADGLIGQIVWWDGPFPPPGGSATESIAVLISRPITSSCEGQEVLTFTASAVTFEKSRMSAGATQNHARQQQSWTPYFGPTVIPRKYDNLVRWHDESSLKCANW